MGLLVCAECGKCMFNSNHDACVSKYLNDVNARTKKPKVVPISASKPKRKMNKSVATPHKKTVASDTTIQKPKSYFKELYENTNKAWKWWIEKKCPSEYKWTQTTPSRPSLKWKPTGRIFSNVRLRWVPTGKLFNSCTGKVDSEPTHGSIVDIPHIHACKQTLGLSAGTSFNGQKQQRIDLNADALYNAKQENLRVWLLKMLISKKLVPDCSDLAPQRQEMSVENVSSGLVPQGQKASDYDNSDPMPPRQNVVPISEKTDSSQQGLNQVHINEQSSSKAGFPKVVSLSKQRQLNIHDKRINPMIQPEPKDLPKDNPKLEIAVLRPIDNSNRRTARGFTLIYENCGFNSHTIDKCFKIIGYPADFGKRKAGSNFKGKNVSNNDVGSNSSIGFSNEQMTTLISLIKENSINGKGIHANTYMNSSVNQHITYTYKNLTSVIDVSYLKIKVTHPNGTRAFITKIKNMPLTNYLTLYDVMVVPEYCVSLISVHKVARDSKLVIAFDEMHCYVMNQDLREGKILGTGKQIDGMYYFDGNQGGLICGWSSSMCHIGGVGDEELVGFEEEAFVEYSIHARNLDEEDEDDSELEEFMIIRYALESNLEPDEWIKDSGCSKHMTGNKSSSSTLQAYIKEHVDNLGFNLLSVGQICDHKCRVNFSKHDSEITKDGKVIEMLKKFGLEESKPMKTPMSSDTKLMKDEECESVDSTKYRGMIVLLSTHFCLQFIMSEYPELSNDSYVLYNRVMTPLAAQLARKPRRDHGTRRGRPSTSSSTFDQPSSSHLNDDDDDGNDDGTLRASTPSPIRYVNSLTN
ncbi:hypothetical protein Tco_0259995 [Tanacetum coccineum]